MEVLKLRKAGFEDAFFIIAVLFAFAIVLLVVNKAWSEMKPNLEESINNVNPNINITPTLNSVTGTTQLFDKLLPLLIIGLFAFVLIGVSLYINHPIMLVVGIIVLAVAIMLGVIYANVYNEISSSESFSSTNDNLPITEIFMKYLPVILFIMIIGIIGIIIYSRQGSGGSGL
jgi:hypothetical protein